MFHKYIFVHPSLFQLTGMLASISLLIGSLNQFFLTFLVSFLVISFCSFCQILTSKHLYKATHLDILCGSFTKGPACQGLVTLPKSCLSHRLSWSIFIGFLFSLVSTVGLLSNQPNFICHPSFNLPPLHSPNLICRPSFNLPPLHASYFSKHIHSSFHLLSQYSASTVWESLVLLFWTSRVSHLVVPTISWHPLRKVDYILAHV